MSERIIVSKTGYGKTAKFYEDLIKETIEEKDKEIERLNNIIENFEEELEREINIKEEDTGLEHDRYLLIKDTLETMLRRFINIKGVDKE